MIIGIDIVAESFVSSSEALLCASTLPFSVVFPLMACDDDDKDAAHQTRMRMVPLLLALAISRKKKKTRQPFWQKLNQEGRLRRERGSPRVALPSPSDSPWNEVHESCHDGAFVTVTGFDRESFLCLLALFQPCFEGFTPWVANQDGFNCRCLKPTERRGRKRIVVAASCLGSVLFWCRFSGGEFTLQGWFGFAGGHANSWLRFGRRMLLKASEGHPDAVAEMPTDGMLEFCEEAIHKRHSSLKNVCCFADGLKLDFEACDDLEEQGMHCNGWTHGHCVTNPLVFSAAGRIIDSVMNAPGSIHDFTLAVWGGVHRRLKQMHDSTSGTCAVDSAFAANQAPHLI